MSQRPPRFAWGRPGRATRGGSPFFVSPAGHLRAPWRLSVFGSAFVLSWVMVNAFAYPVLTFLTAAMVPPPPLYPWLVLGTTWIAILVALHHVDEQDWAAIGLHGAAWRLPRLVRGALLGVVAMVAVLSLLLLTGGLRVVLAGDGSGPAQWMATGGRALWLLMPAALWEELVFRGYLWRVAEDAAGERVALWSTSVAFGALHLSNPGATIGTLTIVVLAGLCLGVVRSRTGSLPAAWMAHLGWNWIMAAFAHTPVSGLVGEAPGWRLEPGTPVWWSGGSWGPEGGAAAFVVLLAGLVAMLRWQRSNTPASTSSDTSWFSRARSPVTAPSEK